jgi:hypothetical protein
MQFVAVEHDPLPKPIYIRLGKGGKKRRYSKGLKGLQQTGRHLAKASTRMARATAGGMATFEKAADKSAFKRKDGALRDFSVNVGKALRTSLRKSSRIPLDVARAFDSPQTRRATRRQIRFASGLGRLFRV